MAKVGPKMVVTLTLWCVALTIGFLGMACYLVTAGGWRKDCKQLPDNGQLGGKTNNTRQQLTLPTHTDSPQPCGKKTDRPDPQKDAGHHVSKLPIAHIIAAGKFNSSSVKWESSRKESTLQSMNYSDGFIIIAEPGHYYVYSQVSFVGASCENGSEVLESTVLYLQHSGRSSQHPLELMEAAQSVCEGPNNKPWYHSLRQGGVFQLSKDTHLSMKISPFNRAELEHHKTYFGAFKIQ